MVVNKNNSNPTNINLMKAQVEVVEKTYDNFRKEVTRVYDASKLDDSFINFLWVSGMSVSITMLNRILETLDEAIKRGYPDAQSCKDTMLSDIPKFSSELLKLYERTKEFRRNEKRNQR